MITVRDIPTIKGLESIRIRAGAEFADKAIRWPYLAEDHELDPWLVGGEVIFITGINRSWTDDEFICLLHSAKNKNAAAIILLTGSAHISALNLDWVTLANEHQLPLLEQPFSLPMVVVTERLSNAIIQSTFAQRSKEWFLTQLVENPTETEAIALEQARDIGLPHDSELSMAMVLPNTSASKSIESWKFILREFIAEQKSPFPVIEYRTGWLLCLVKDHDNNQAKMEAWQHLHSMLQSKQLLSSIGVSDGFTLSKLNRLAFQAKQCTEFIHRHFRGQVFHYKTFGLQQLFAAVDDIERLHDFCHRYLGPYYQLNGEDVGQVKQTLRCYFTNLCSVRSTASDMGIHRNTVTARIQKFEQRTHLSLDDAGNRLAIQNALVIESFILPQTESR
ncbi:PucR family transcriptional regulator [Vibrio sp. MA40-2]|uniref:PucR family transcriptional regulator n=1 Tax=Vibrio sp. MA40-2 TaxID=3391828 RepID=UPI0039A56E00